jgi:hypothetical protein
MPNGTPKKSKKPAPKRAKTPAPSDSPVSVLLAAEDSDDYVAAALGDSAHVVDLPGADRQSLARHLTMIAGNVLATHGDPIDGATIVVVTARAKKKLSG